MLKADKSRDAYTRYSASYLAVLTVRTVLYLIEVCMSCCPVASHTLARNHSTYSAILMPMLLSSLWPVETGRSSAFVTAIPLARSTILPRQGQSQLRLSAANSGKKFVPEDSPAKSIHFLFSFPNPITIRPPKKSHR